MLKIEVNYNNVLETIGDNINLIIADTLSETAKLGKESLQNKMISEQKPSGAGFYLRRQWIVNGIRVDFASVSKGKYQSRIYFTEYDSAYMQRQETGGIKTVSGKRVAVPLTTAMIDGHLSKGAIDSRSELVKAQNKPKGLHTLSSKPFVITAKNGNQYLVVREKVIQLGSGKTKRTKGKKIKSTLNFKYALKSNINVKKRLGMHDFLTVQIPILAQKAFENTLRKYIK